MYEWWYGGKEGTNRYKTEAKMMKRMREVDDKIYTSGILNKAVNEVVTERGKYRYKIDKNEKEMYEEVEDERVRKLYTREDREEQCMRNVADEMVRKLYTREDGEKQCMRNVADERARKLYT